MYLFKTSGETFASVIANQKHAFVAIPRDWCRGELVLVSKNKSDCSQTEKQIQYVMRLDNIRLLEPGETDRYWPGNEGRWKYLVECTDIKRISQPFNLADILGDEARVYAPVMTFKRLSPEHEQVIGDYLHKIGVF